MGWFLDILPHLHRAGSVEEQTLVDLGWDPSPRGPRIGEGFGGRDSQRRGDGDTLS